MATKIVETDVLLEIYSSSINGTTVGTLSKYDEVPHPGTNKLIKGFEWDVRTWPSDEELEAVAYAPSIWDPGKNFLFSEDFQSGIGDNEDLQLISIDRAEARNMEFWIPKINHGYIYVQDEEWYVFSDDFQTQDFYTNQTYSGLQYQDLKYDLKIGIPIQVRRYSYDKVTGQYSINLNLRKKVAFSGDLVAGTELPTVNDEGIIILSNIDTTKEEFVVSDHFGTPPRVLLNKSYAETVGGDITLTVSGTVATGTTDSLEILGIGDGTASEFHSTYSPIDPSGVITLWTWNDSNEPVQWTRIDSLASFTPGPNRQYKLDTNLGIFNFGNYDGTASGQAGLIPGLNTKIGLRYTKGIHVEYEPVDSRDYLLAPTADTNPLHNASEKGFIKLATEITDPTSIFLEADLPLDLNGLYLIDAGNQVGEIIANVTDTNGDTVEGVQVYFEIIAPFVGNFTNGDLITTSITDSDGQARAFFAPPASIDSLGKPTTNVVYNGGSNTTKITVSGVTAPSTTSGVFIFQVGKYDPILGMTESGLNQFYTDFFAAEKITGTTANRTWEENHRTVHNLLKPTTYPSGDIITGGKKIMFSVDNTVVDPHYGDQVNFPIFAPIVPLTTANIGTQSAPAVELTYQGNIPAPGINTNFKSYLVVAEALSFLRAYVINKKNLKKIYSNTISISIQIPDNANGVLIANNLSEVQSGMFNRVRHINEISDAQINTFYPTLSGEWLEDRFPRTETYIEWFRRTRRADTKLIPMETYAFSGDLPARIPFGFRLKSPGITVASLLDSVTFLDINDTLPSGYI